MHVFHQFWKVFRHFIFCPVPFLLFFGTSSHILCALDIQNVVQLSAEASPGSMLEMQNLRFHPRPYRIRIWILIWPPSDWYAQSSLKITALSLTCSFIFHSFVFLSCFWVFWSAFQSTSYLSSCVSFVIKSIYRVLNFRLIVALVSRFSIR